jgi:hypothetical protein
VSKSYCTYFLLATRQNFGEDDKRFSVAVSFLTIMLNETRMLMVRISKVSRLSLSSNQITLSPFSFSFFFIRFWTAPQKVVQVL